MKKLVLHSDKKILPRGVSHAEILYPFWGSSPEPVEMIDAHRFDNYIGKGKDIFKYSENIKEADLVVLPTDWKRYKRTDTTDMAIDYCKLVESHKKKLLVFYLSDFDDQIPLSDNAIIVRTSLGKTKKAKNEFALPVWSYDYVSEKLGGRIIPREKHSKPVIGFCGNAVPRKKSLKRLLVYFLINRFRLNIPVNEHYLDLRHRILGVFQTSRDVSANFIIRDAYYGGAQKNGEWNLDALRVRRDEYFENMIESDYMLCMRGSGNFSFRFYETLSSGRIPVFINTDCELPYDSLIDYKDHCVWVEAKDLKYAIDELLKFHDRLSNADFRELQLRNRSLWLDWLSPQGFFEKLHLMINAS